MAFIPEEKVQEIRDRANIVSVISQYVPLKKIGANYKACCPFHPEKTASFVVSDAKRIYHCFGCGKGGNVFTFLMEYTGLSFPEAIQKLADQVGVVIPVEKYSVVNSDQQSLKKTYYAINKQALLFFKEQLKHSKTAQKFLKERGLDSALVDIFHLGFIPDEWHLLEHALLKKGISKKHLVDVGLIVQKEGGETYDKFRNRLIFPLFDLNKRVLGFGGRTCDLHGSPKYLNSAESPIYHKSRELYGLS